MGGHLAVIAKVYGSAALHLLTACLFCVERRDKTCGWARTSEVDRLRKWQTTWRGSLAFIECARVHLDSSATARTPDIRSELRFIDDSETCPRLMPQAVVFCRRRFSADVHVGV